MRTLPHLRQRHRADPGAEPWHLLLPQMPTFWFRASDIKAGSGGIRTSDQGLASPLVHLAVYLPYEWLCQSLRNPQMSVTPALFE